MHHHTAAVTAVAAVAAVATVAAVAAPATTTAIDAVGEGRGIQEIGLVWGGLWDSSEKEGGGMGLRACMHIPALSE